MTFSARFSRSRPFGKEVTAGNRVEGTMRLILIRYLRSYVSD